jgi:hypothetical protein
MARDRGGDYGMNASLRLRALDMRMWLHEAEMVGLSVKSRHACEVEYVGLMPHVSRLPRGRHYLDLCIRNLSRGILLFDR